MYGKQEIRGQNSDFVHYRQGSVQPMPGNQVRPFSTLDVRSRTTSSEGSSEGEVVINDRKIKEKKKGGMFGFLKKKYP
ncbi:spectrin beta chain, non-erythrocytic 5 [Caerostris extrusa]|nr:spectrin beta chain, non-erythrocytic 5 [Caerostris extrusa]